MNIFEKDVDISKMKKLGVITIARNRIDRDDARLMLSEDKTLTQSFFDRMKQTTYTFRNGDCILSTMDSGNLVLAHYDNNVIFLLSEDSVLSPKEFVETLSKIMQCSNEMNSLLARKSRHSCSCFGFNNLNINFAQMEFATEMPPEIIEHYVFAGKPAQTVMGKIYGECANNIGLEFNSARGTSKYTHTSEYGTSLLGFVNEIVRTNPDMRLLMSNVVCYRKEPEIAQAMADTIGLRCSLGYFERGQTLSRDLFQRALSNFDNLVKDKEFLRTFEEEKRCRILQRHNNNEKYAVYEALKAVVERNDNIDNIDNFFQLEWHDGDPDTGTRAIYSSLNRIAKAEMMERDENCLAPRGIKEVKEYMGDVTAKAHHLSREDREQAEKKQKTK